MKTVCFLLASMLFLSVNARAQDKNFFVFLSFGQSNMEGFPGIEEKDLNLNPEQVPLLAGELVGADQHGACASMNAIIDDLPKTIPNSYAISSEGCTWRPDHLHFTPAGYRELGKRYGEKMLSLLDYQRKSDAP